MIFIEIHEKEDFRLYVKLSTTKLMKIDILNVGYHSFIFFEKS